MTKPSKILSAVSKNKKGPKRPTSNSFSVSNYELSDIFRFVLSDELENLDKDTKDVMIHGIITAAISVVILAQISQLSNQKQQYVDSLSSVKHYKKKFISGLPGRMLSTILSLYEIGDNFSVRMSEIIETYFTSSIVPCKKIVGKTTKGNALSKFQYLRTVFLGYLQSCPSTNIKIFNLDSSVATWTLDETLKFILPANWDPKYITKSDIIDELQSILLSEKDEKSIDSITFSEPNNINSPLEKEIFGDLIIRNGEVSVTVQESGKLPDNALTKEQLAELLSPRDYRQYVVALAIGDTNLAKKLTDIALNKANNKSSDS